MHILMYGPEGSGKGTQSKLLSEKLNVPILTSGDLVREAAAKDKGMIGDVCRAALSEGKYVADSEMYVLWKRRLKEDDAKADWIMDGFPRNTDQAIFLDDKLNKYGYKVEYVFYLNISEEESLSRLVKRARPLHPGSTELHDSPERIRHRLQIYKQHEQGVLEYYKKQGVLFQIDALGSVDEIHARILSHITHE